MSRDAEKYYEKEKESIVIKCKKGIWSNLILEVHKKRCSGAWNEQGSAGHERGMRS